MSAKGILGRKLGMTQIWDDENRVVPVTVIEAGPCRVVQLKTPERDGYAAVQLAFGDTKPQRLSKPELGHLKKADAGGTLPARRLLSSVPTSTHFAERAPQAGAKAPSRPRTNGTSNSCAQSGRKRWGPQISIATQPKCSSWS